MKGSSSQDKQALATIEELIGWAKVAYDNVPEDDKHKAKQELRALVYAKQAILELRRRREWGEQLNRKNTE